MKAFTTTSFKSPSTTPKPARLLAQALALATPRRSDTGGDRRAAHAPTAKPTISVVAAQATEVAGTAGKRPVVAELNSTQATNASRAKPPGVVKNEDIADSANTVLKMARKRGFVDGVLTATSSSDRFGQDLEDDPPAEDSQPTQTSAAPAQAVAQPAVQSNKLPRTIGNLKVTVAQHRGRWLCENARQCEAVSQRSTLGQPAICRPS